MNKPMNPDAGTPRTRVEMNHFAKMRIVSQYDLIKPDPNRLPRTKPLSSRHLDGLSDLVVSAPIKEGFIDAFEHVTYETRFRIAMDALFKLRSTSREYNLIKPLLDTTERINSIRSFRLAIIEIPTETKTEKRLLEAVTFDRPWEPYIRTIWDPLGPLLDLLLCNCEGYVTAVDHSFEQYAQWIRDNQVDTGFFYATTALSVGDLNYLVESEKQNRENAPSLEADIAAAAVVCPDPLQRALETQQNNRPQSDDLAFDALGALYRLTSYYPLDRGLREGRFLHRAARSLLKAWDKEPLTAAPATTPDRFAGTTVDRKELLDWYRNDAFSEWPERPIGEELCDAANVQGGILTGFDKRGEQINQGCLLLMQAGGGEGARGFLGDVAPYIAREDPQVVPPRKLSGFDWDPKVHLNLALTLRGLRTLEVPAAEIAKFPQEFLEGPEERAGLFGDVMHNHPRRWRMPPRNWPGPDKAAPPVELSEIDFVLQLRTATQYDHDLFRKDGKIDPNHPLAGPVQALAKWAQIEHGVRLLSVQSMRSIPEPLPNPGSAGGYVTREHFGFLDGFSQPSVKPDAPDGVRVRLGEILLGFSNDRGDRRGERNPYLYEGSFLVVRKIRQHVEAFRNWVAQHGGATPDDRETLYARLMGRTRDGVPLAPPGASDFDFIKDTGTFCPRQSHVRRANPRNEEHGRPAPRIMRRGMSYGKRLPVDGTENTEAERGIVFMCYQASIAEQYEVVQRWLNGGNSTDLLSMHNDPVTGVGRPADKRTFRWSDGKTVIRCPLDDEKEGRNRFVSLEWLLYLFAPSLSAIEHIVETGKPAAAELEIGERQLLALGEKLMGKLRLGEEQLQAKDALDPLSANEPLPAKARTALLLFFKLVGNYVRESIFGPRRSGINHLAPVARLWKAILEDFGAKDPAERAYGPAVWAAIRAKHGGILRVPYGDFEAGDPVRSRPITRAVLVADKDLVREVFDDPHGRYSVEGDGERQARMDESIGRIYVGLDDGETYRRESKDTNPILYAVTEEAAFKDSYRISEAVLKTFLATAPMAGGMDGAEPGRKRSASLEISGKLITPAVADICTQWFGIPDALGEYVEKGTWRRFGIKPDDPSRCPGDYIAPSRGIFYPDPNPAVRDYSKALGRRLHANVKRMYGAMHEAGQTPLQLMPYWQAGAVPMLAEEIYQAVWKMPLSDEEKIDLLTRNVIGAMTGMIPPLDGNLRGMFYGWLKDRSLWRLQRALGPGSATDAYTRAVKALRQPLIEAMQRRPAPDLVWRTVKHTHRLGDLKVRKGEKLIVAIVSATLQSYAERRSAGGARKPDDHPYRGVAPVFGGLHKKDEALHACPAYKMAMGTMMGMVTALLDSGVLEPHPATLTVQLTER